MESIRFKDYQEIKDLYDTGKYNIFYFDGEIEYEVIHIGSILLCFDEKKHRGMGAITNFPVEHFYADEKPKEESVNENINSAIIDRLIEIGEQVKNEDNSEGVV